ncbi:lamin tail domain-containing protein [Fibrobacter sp. UWB10]|uniref:lamin tail domain-containing protein n=1 Tax=Fibrobacter sp. UWB10 TaxID=1896201 RepID=UPI0024032067|nr:lamin tail domain-containing protein [Fibrobacter sp. UWB10]SMP39777.1 Lamin Tail Domain [Fibrobacter sp. UWB10]
MDIKKILLAGSAVTAMVLATSCSSDKSSEPDPSDPTLSSSSENGTIPGSSGDVPVTGSSSSDGNSTPVPGVSSSSVADESVTQMAITEIMYNADDGSALEWVEVTIQSGPDIASMLASGMRLDGALSFTFPNEPLKKGEYIVVTNDKALFMQTYPDFQGKLYGPWDNDPKTGAVAKLSNEGDVIDVKLTGEGDVSCSYSMEPPWPSLANGKGRTLVYKGGNAAQATSWGASKIMNGNPGVGNDEWLTTSNIRLNEIMPTGTGTDAWVELYNAGAEAVDVTGWIFESKIRKEKLTIKAGTVPAKGYLVLNATTDFVNSDGEPTELIVSDIGGSYYLYGATEGDESSLLLPSSKLSSGVVDLSDGSTAQGALVTATPGEPNSTLYIGSLVITEINYHPNEDDLNDAEFLELKNVSEVAITPYEKLTSGNRGWKIEGINFEFSATDVIPAGGLVVLFPDSLKAAYGEEGMRKRYAIDASVLISFYSGKLSNRGEMIAVKKPYFFQNDVSNPLNSQWYYDWSDATLYSDNWSGNGIDYKRADGYGYSLQRKDFTTMGYEAAAWTVDKPTPGK